MSSDNEQTVLDNYQYYNSHQKNTNWLNKILESCDPNIILTVNGIQSKGYDAIRQNLGGWAKGFPGSQITVEKIRSSDNQVIVQFWGRGVHTGILHTPNGDIQPTNKELNLFVEEIYTYNQEGKIIALEVKFDGQNMLHQLGVAA